VNLCCLAFRTFFFDKDRLESDWCIDDDTRALIYPPDDLAAWLNGDIDFLEDKFHETLKSEALKSLKTRDAFTETQFVPGAVLPTRWHEGQEPLPNFWLAEQWDWIAEGEFSTGYYPLATPDTETCCRQLHVGQSHPIVVSRPQG
jgi:hypothetical protein